MHASHNIEALPLPLNRCIGPGSLKSFTEEQLADHVIHRQLQHENPCHDAKPADRITIFKVDSADVNLATVQVEVEGGRVGRWE